MQLQLELPNDSELGVFADFANIWHTPATFVLDFLSVKGPPNVMTDDEGNPVAILSSRVGARVRIPPEQIFPLIEALQAQGQEWLNETGRSAPPETWLKGAQPSDEAGTIDLGVDGIHPSDEDRGSQP